MMTGKEPISVTGVYGTLNTATACGQHGLEVIAAVLLGDHSGSLADGAAEPNMYLVDTVAPVDGSSRVVPAKAPVAPAFEARVFVTLADDEAHSIRPIARAPSGNLPDTVLTNAHFAKAAGRLCSEGNE
ncbi:hypothetical protein [Tropicimonas isoalkanivorans]|nr:hypothetical protein [Tropicimonas isoalkanivorans]